MRRLIAAASALVLVAPAAAAAQERTPSHCIALAESIGRVIPASFGAPLAEGDVRIRFVDHATFVIETPGGMVAATDYTGLLGTADVVPDVVTMNNAHGTHWTSTPDPRIPHVLPGWGDDGRAADHRLEVGDLLVRNVPTDVRSGFGEGRKDGNSIFIFETAGLCIGHLGHLHHIPDDAQFAAIGRLDVVMVPVDGGYTMAVEEMAKVVSRLRSSVVLPMHWFSGASLQTFLDDMRADFQIVELEQPDIELSIDKLPSRPTIMVLNPAWLE